MDVFISDSRIDQLIAEDLPYIDLTTEVLGIGSEPGEIEFFTREECVLSCVEEAGRMMERLGVAPTFSLPSGTMCRPGDVFLRGEGTAAALHRAWKVCLTTVDHYSAVATKTRKMVEAAHAANPRCEILTTRKSMPGARDLLVKAVTTGGAFPHRLGLSETVLVFDNHVEFLGGFDELVRRIPEFRSKCIEKKLFVEVEADMARACAEAGADGLQLDKMEPGDLARLVGELKRDYPHVTLIAAGGINADNVAEYAATGVDGLATTAPFTARPVDMSVKMRRL